MPWPHDLRRTERGTVELSDFPNPRNSAILKRYLEMVDRDVHGFATMPVIYIPATEALSSEGLPTIAESLSDESLIQLVDLSAEGCGKRVPISVRADGPADGYEAPFRFTVEVVLGATLHPSLHPSRPYGLLLWEGLKTANGELIPPTASFQRALRGEFEGEGVRPDDGAGTGEGREPWEAALARAHAPLRRCMGEVVEDDRLLLATVFTTQGPVDEMLRLRETVRNPDVVPMKELVSFERSTRYSTASRSVYVGAFSSPVFLRGETPYATSGGGLDFDAQGAPVVHRWEDVPFTVSFPADGTGPHATIVWVDGTGATLGSPIGDGWYQRALSEGFAVATLVAPFHDARAVPGSDEVLSSFNYLNPEAGRTVFRQQAAEISYFYESA